MTKEDLIELKKRISNLSEEEKKQRDLYLKKIANDEILGPVVGYPSIDKTWLKNYSDEGILSSLPKKTIYRYAKDMCEGFDKDIAIEVFGFKIPTKRFWENVDKAANSLVALGVKKGDYVTICSPTFPETIYVNFALMKIGAIANNIDPRNNPSSIAESINDTNSKYVITLDIAYPKIEKIKNDINVNNVICISYSDSIPFYAKRIFNKKLVKKLDMKGLKIPKIEYGKYCLTWKQFLKKGINTEANEVSYEPNMPASTARTGGTTGKPKTAVLTHDDGIALVEQYKYTDLGLERGQSLLNVMPEFIAYGWTFGVVMATCLGIKNIVISQFDQDELADNIIKYRPNHLVGVPTHYIGLMNDEKMNSVDFSDFLKSISAGGDKFLIEKEEEFNKWLAEHKYDKKTIVGYGVTERSSSVATRLNKCNDIGSCGIPLVKNNIAIFKFPMEGELYSEEELGYDEYGEVCISGPSSMFGYFNDQEETNKVQIMHSDGTLWTHTKDRGYMSKNGVLYISGRTKNMIIRPDGHNVWPLEMENIIVKHNKVLDCCVVGIPAAGKMQGEWPRAVVVLDKEYTPSEIEKIELELRDMCLSALPERDVPIDYSFNYDGSLPLTDVGKIDAIKVRKREIEKSK